MSLIVIITYIFFALIGRIYLVYKLTGSFGTENTYKSIKSNIYYIICSYIGFGGMISLAVLDFRDRIDPQFEIGDISIASALFLAIIGLTITILAQHQMGISWRAIIAKSKNTELITHGLFQYSRNPVYMGTLILFFSTVVLFPHILMLTCFLFAYLSIELIVRYDEELHLRKVHGDKYEQYCRRVNRFFPKIF